MAEGPLERTQTHAWRWVARMLAVLLTGWAVLWLGLNLWASTNGCTFDPSQCQVWGMSLGVSFIASGVLLGLGLGVGVLSSLGKTAGSWPWRHLLVHGSALLLLLVAVSTQYVVELLDMGPQVAGAQASGGPADWAIAAGRAITSWPVPVVLAVWLLGYLLLLRRRS